jgi:hypothetical protein
MPKADDLNTAVQSIVAREVEALLEPHLLRLERLAGFMGSTGTRPAPRRMSTPTPAPRRSPRRARPARRVAAPGIQELKVGDAVAYRQGRGEFGATIKAIDLDAGTVLLARLGDGKKVVRPITKVRVGGARAATKAAKATKVARASKRAKATRAAKPAKAPKAAKAAKPAKQPKATKVKAEKKPRKPANTNTGIMKPKQPDELLAEIVGDKPLPRGEVIKRLWHYIKSNGLQDTVNKRMINADEKLAKVFNGKKKVVMFEMLTLVNKHLG